MFSPTGIYEVSIIPTIPGDGKSLFIGGTAPVGLESLPSKYFDTGLVQLHYRKKLFN